MFDHPVTPLAQVGKQIAAGITLEPATAGAWLWLDDKTLIFTPKDDWAAGAIYTVRFQQTLFKPEAQLAENSAPFATFAFAATIMKAGFYQDPLNAAVKKVVVDLGFTYPVNPAELEERIALQQTEQQSASNVLGILGIGKTSTRFTVSDDKLKLHAYVASEDLPIPKDGGKLRFAPAPGLTAACGSPALHSTPKNKSKSFWGNRRARLGIDEIHEPVKVSIKYRNCLAGWDGHFSGRHVCSFMHFIYTATALFLELFNLAVEAPAWPASGQLAAEGAGVRVDDPRHCSNEAGFLKQNSPSILLSY